MPRRLGHLREQPDPRNLQLHHYLLDTSILPRNPDYRTSRLGGFGDSVGSWGMMGNDTLGDCTIAALGHAVQTWSKINTGTVHTPSDADVKTLYWETGDPPAATGSAHGPTDTGRAGSDVMKYITANGLFGDDVNYYFEIINSRKVFEYAIKVFGGFYLGLLLPLSAQAQDDNEETWTVLGSGSRSSKPGGWGAHAVWCYDYSPYYLWCVSWGAIRVMSWSFVRKYFMAPSFVVATDWFPPDNSLFDHIQAALDLTIIQAA